MWRYGNIPGGGTAAGAVAGCIITGAQGAVADAFFGGIKTAAQCLFN